MSQTGGGCRATNYIGLIRKALKDAGLEKIPIISINMSGLEGEQAFHWTPSILNKILQAVVYGDLLMKLQLATRPYENTQGTAEKLYNKWLHKCYGSLANGKINEFKDKLDEFRKDTHNIVIEEYKKEE